MRHTNSLQLTEPRHLVEIKKVDFIVTDIEGFICTKKKMAVTDLGLILPNMKSGCNSAMHTVHDKRSDSFKGKAGVACGNIFGRRGGGGGGVYHP